MNPKTKKILFITLFALDMALTVFLFVVSIIMLATMPRSVAEKANVDPNSFIGYLQTNPTVFLLTFVLPLFILLGVNVYILIRFVKKTNEKKKVQLNELSDEEKEALRKELMKDLASNPEEKKEE